jgi:hypothetical protein
VDHCDCVGAGCAHQAHGGHLRPAGVRPPVPANTQHHVQQQPGWRQCCAGQGGGRRQQEVGHTRHLDGPVAGICCCGVASCCAAHNFVPSVPAMRTAALPGPILYPGCLVCGHLWLWGVLYTGVCCDEAVDEHSLQLGQQDLG